MLWQSFSSIGLLFPLFNYQVICGYLRRRLRMSFQFRGTKKAEAFISENGHLFLAEQCQPLSIKFYERAPFRKGWDARPQGIKGIVVPRGARG